MSAADRPVSISSPEGVSTPSGPELALAPVPRRTGRPAPAQAEQITADILRAANHLFVTHGYAGTTMALLAREAHVSKKTIYARFTDKSQLFETVVLDHVARLAQTQHGDHLPGQPLLERLYALGCSLLEWSLRPDVVGLYRVSVAEAPRFPELAEQIFNHAVKSALAETMKVLASSQLAAQCSPNELLVLATHFMSSCITPPFIRALQARTSAKVDDSVRADLHVAVRLFLHGASAGCKPD